MVEALPTAATGPGTRDRSRNARALARRWPTWSALVLAGVNLADVGDGLEYAVVLALAAASYLFVAVVDRPRATWPILAAMLAMVALLRVSTSIPGRCSPRSSLLWWRSVC